MPRRPLKRVTRLRKKSMFSPSGELPDPHAFSGALRQPIIDGEMFYDRNVFSTNYEPREYEANIKPVETVRRPVGDLNYTPSFSRQLKGIELGRNLTKPPRYGPFISTLDAKAKPSLKLFTDPWSLSYSGILTESGQLNKGLTRKALKEMKRRFPDVDKLDVVVEYAHTSPAAERQHERFMANRREEPRPLFQTKFKTRTIRLRRK